MNLGKTIVIPSFMFVMMVYKEGKKTASDAHNRLNISYSNVLDTNKSIISLGWAKNVHKDKKSIYVELTEKGMLIAESIELFLEAVGIVTKEEEKNVNNENNRDRHGSQSTEPQKQVQEPTRT